MIFLQNTVVGKDARSRLVEAATSEFLAQGYGQANVGRIATAAGISKKTVYKHFDSKLDLLHAVMQASMVAKLVDIGSYDIEMEPRERLVAHLNAFAELAFSPDGIRSYRLFMSEGARFQEMARLYIGAISLFGIEPLARDIAAYVSANKLSVEDPVLAARMLMAMVFAEPMRDAGLGVAEPLMAAESTKLIEAAVTLFLHGALPTAATQP
jgi:AcrR family transcriptional regulator